MSQQINLFNPGLKAQAPKSYPLTRLVLVSLAAATVSTIGAVHERGELRKVEKDAVRAAETLKETKLTVDALAAQRPAQAAQAQSDGEFERLAAEVATRQELLEAIANGSVGNNKGFSEFMRAFSRQADGSVWLTGFDLTAGGTSLTVNGRTLDPDGVSQYLQRLRSEPLFSGRQLASMLLTKPTAAQSGNSKGEAPRYHEFSIASGDGSAGKREAPVPAPAIANANANVSDVSPLRAQLAKMDDVVRGEPAKSPDAGRTLAKADPTPPVRTASGPKP